MSPLNLRFRRRRCGRGVTDQTDISLTCSVFVVIFVILAVLVTSGVITPDAFTRIAERSLKLPQPQP
jgi:hypothetical protein